MPSVTFSEAELQALYAAYTAAARLDWPAYDRARQRIIDAAQKHAATGHPVGPGLGPALRADTPRAPRE